MNPEDPWDFEEWNTRQRVGLLAILAVVVVSAGTGIALVPVLMTVGFVAVVGYVGWWFYRRMLYG